MQAWHAAADKMSNIDFSIPLYRHTHTTSAGQEWYPRASWLVAVSTVQKTKDKSHTQEINLLLVHAPSLLADG